MSKDNDKGQFSFSRRKLLGSMATIGAAGALGGAGTMAFFSDEENFENNRLTAGALDLKVDWEEHYSDWSADEEEGLSEDVLMEDPDDPSYVGLPNPSDPLIWVHRNDLDQFMNNTSIEAYPDENGDGAQDQDEFGNPVFPNADSICETNSDLPRALRSPLRTQNEDTMNEGGSYKPLVSLEDVKPGDFGELTLSFHLCDNPGYLWMQGECQAFENGRTEPERQDPDEKDGVVEILDAIQTVAWYDQDGDNVLDGASGQPVCAQIVLDASGSMTETDGDGVTRNQEAINGATQLADTIIDAGGRVGVTFFSPDDGPNPDDSGTVVQSIGDAGSTNKTTTDGVISGLPANGSNTAIGNGIEAAAADIDANCDPATERAIMIVVTDGQNNTGTNPGTASSNAISGDTEEIFAVGTGGANVGTLEDIAFPVDDAHVELTSDLTNAIANLSAQIVGEEVFFQGNLRELCEALSTPAQGQNVPGIPLDGNRATEERACFNASDTNHIGLAWYLPVDHANEIQTDRVAFDLGFYTEQCRHNDGSGNRKITTKTGEGFAKIEETFNGDETISGGARARYGDNGGTAEGELYVGNEPGTDYEQAEYLWSPDSVDWSVGPLDWTVAYDASADELSFTFDGTNVTATLDNPQPDGRMALQCKADEGTVSAMVDNLSIGGSSQTLSSPTSVSASNDGSGRQITYLLIDTALDGSTDFELSGTAEVAVQDDYSGNEGVAFDVIFE